jgi:hypothetical protein
MDSAIMEGGDGPICCQKAGGTVLRWGNGCVLCFMRS